MVRASKKKKGLLFRDVIEEKQQKEKEEGFFSLFLSFNISCVFFSRGAWFTFDRLWTHHSSSSAYSAGDLLIANCLSLRSRLFFFYLRFSLAFLSVHPPPSVRADRSRRKKGEKQQHNNMWTACSKEEGKK
jgi:hypothetical protein